MASKQISAAILAAGILAAGSVCAQPDTFRCGSYLIRKGMAALDIIDRCGEPDDAQLVEEPIFAWLPGGGRVQTGVKMIEVWTYDRGSRSFPARITIEEGIATEVAVLSRR